MNTTTTTILFLFFFFIQVESHRQITIQTGSDDSFLQCIQTQLELSSNSIQIGLPGSLLYKKTINIDNRRVVHKPQLVLSPLQRRDVQYSISAVRYCNGRLTSVSGGHGAAGWALNSGNTSVVLNVRDQLNQIQWHNRTNGQLYVESGALWSSIYEFVQDSGRLPIGGGCPQVGIAGFLMGAGWSFLSRSYGLAIDNVAQIEFVLANSTLVVASAQHNQDLYWAARGGGGGNFGVATSFIIETHPPRPKMVVGEICWPPLNRTILNKLWSIWLKNYESLPAFVDIVPVWLPIGTNNSRMFCFTVVCNGEETACYPHLSIYLEQSPTLNTLETQSFIDWQLANVNVTDAQHGQLYLTSAVLNPGALTLKLVNALIDLLEVAPNNRSLILFHVGGGQIANVKWNATAFPHRQAQLIIQVKAIWELDEDTQHNMQWVRDVRTLLLPFISGSYVNYIDPEFPNWQEAYYGGNLERLKKIRYSIDPEHFFSFPQAIP
mmetsp:Transcript_8385/g.12756  ORF Transcript_8385/g.12756 Transcript_8385/m.12756 type:complete len:492 (+) Transcript_8385:79-1554(+)